MRDDRGIGHDDGGRASGVREVYDRADEGKDSGHCRDRFELYQDSDRDVQGGGGIWSGRLLVTPYYNKATQAGLAAHYTAVAKEVKTPIIMYSVASRTGCNIEPATVAALVNGVENIVGIKEASGNIGQVARIMALTDGNIDLYSGNDDQIVPLLSLGGRGVISVLSNVAPRQTHDICAKYFEGDVKGSARMQLEALPLIEQLFCEVNPIPVKKAMQLMGMDCGGLRMPLTELTKEHEASLAKAMKDYGITLA